MTATATAPGGAASRVPLPAAAGLVPLSRVSLFDGLPPRRIAWLVVREGRLALLERAVSGHRVMIAVLDAGAIYSTLGDVEAPGLDALEDVAVAPIPGPALAALAARDPLLARNVAVAFSERVAMLRATAAVLAEIRVEDRLLARVLQLADVFGTATAAGARLDLGLTHAQWGLLVGAARESVTLALGRLRARGELVVEARAITIPWPVMRRGRPG